VASAIAITVAGAAVLTGAAAAAGGPLPAVDVIGQLPESTTTEAIPTTTLAPTTVATTTPTTPPTTARATTAVTPPTTAVAPVTPSALAAPSTTIAPAAEGPETWLVALLVILAMLALVAAVAVVVGLVRHRQQAAGDWQGEVRAALVDVDLSISMATTHSETPDPRPFGQVVTPRLSSLRSRLETVAGQAPNPQLRQEVSAVASGIQSYGFAAEAEWMLRQGAVPPSAEQLDQAGSASFERRAALQSSVTMLRSEIGDPTMSAS
jgi:hypothetical protein